MAIKVLTKEMARKSDRIIIRSSVIIIHYKKSSRKYGVITKSKSYVKNKRNLAVANRYK